MTTILLTNMGLPLEIVGLIAGIFRLIDMANTTFNVTGDVVTTMVVARSEGMMHTLGTGAENRDKGSVRAGEQKNGIPAGYQEK